MGIFSNSSKAIIITSLKICDEIEEYPENGKLFTVVNNSPFLGKSEEEFLFGKNYR